MRKGRKQCVIRWLGWACLVAASCVQAQTLPPQVQAPQVGSIASGQLALDPRALAQNFARIRYDADRGNASAQYQMGLIYEWGMGVYKDIRKAAHWYERASNGGNPWAQVALGALLLKGYTDETGRAAPADPRRAYLLFSQAAQSGVLEGTANLALIYLKGIPESNLKQDLPTAENLLWQVSDAGLSSGPVLLAYAWLSPLLEKVLALNPTQEQLAAPRLPEISVRDRLALALAWATASGFKNVPGAGAGRILELPTLQALMAKAGLHGAIRDNLAASGETLRQAWQEHPASFHAAAQKLSLSFAPTERVSP